MNGFITSMYEWFHPALGYAPHALVYHIWSLFNDQGLPKTFPPVNPAFGSDPFPHAHVFLPEVTQPLGWLRLYPGLFVLRLTSSLLGALTVLVIWRIALVMWPGEPTFALLVAATVALIPEFIFINATVRNDSMANLVSAIALWMMVRFFASSNPHPQQRAIFFLGLAGAVAWLTKYTLLFVVPLAAIVLILAEPRFRTWPMMAGWLVAPIVVSLSLYYLIFPQARQALEFSQLALHIRPDMLKWSMVADGLPLLRDLFWARFGWANVIVPQLWTQIPTVMGLGGIGMSIGTIIYDQRTGRLSATIWRQFAILVLATGLVVIGFIRYNMSLFTPQGRYLFPALGPIVILALFGVWRLGPHWGQRLLAFGIVTGLMTFNLGAILKGIYPAYYQAVLPTAFQNRCSSPVGELYGKTTFGQTFVVHHPNLSRIDVMMATYGRENHLPVVFHLQRGLPETGKQDIVTLKIPPSAITDDKYHSFVFPAIPNSQGQTFYFYLSSARSMTGDAFTLWATSEDAYPEGTRTVNDQFVPGDLCFIAYSDLGAR